MKNLKSTFNLITFGSICVDCLFIIFGIYMMSNPAVGLQSALKIIGIMLLISGIYSIVKYLLHSKHIFKFELIYGIFSIIISLFAIFKPFDVANFITIIIGIWLIITSVFKFLFTIEIRKYVQSSWLFDLTISLLTILIGLIILINPFNGHILISTYVGIMLAIYSAMDMTEQFLIRKRVNEVVRIISKK